MRTISDGTLKELQNLKFNAFQNWKITFSQTRNGLNVTIDEYIGGEFDYCWFSEFFLYNGKYDTSEQAGQQIVDLAILDEVTWLLEDGWDSYDEIVHRLYHDEALHDQLRNLVDSADDLDCFKQKVVYKLNKIAARLVD